MEFFTVKVTCDTAGDRRTGGLAYIFAYTLVLLMVQYCTGNTGSKVVVLVVIFRKWYNCTVVLLAVGL
jgi:hypothetical protein